MFVFEESGKREWAEKRREATTKATHIWRRRLDLNMVTNGGSQVLFASHCAITLALH